VLSIVLRTVCGCERVLAIPFQHYPSEYRVPFIRDRYFHTFPQDGESCMGAFSGHQIRRFEYIGVPGQYGYPVYLEVLEGVNAKSNNDSHNDATGHY
jgi:hypothetical protein